ncbi:MAG: hypothetical protein E6Q85_04220 [Thiothrix sp.]|nr:MAG: hypothetical protein E6Q85_04220 [Thiothrix sp.]
MKRFSLALAVVCFASTANAELSTMSGTIASPSRALSVNARLDFTINISKFIYFGIGGSSSYPATSSTINTVTLNSAVTIPSSSSAITPTNGNNKSVTWNGSAPSFASSNSVVLPVQLRSNAGQLSVRASVISALSNGSETIPFSGVKINSSDSGFPAPVVPDSGTGASVNITPTAFSNFVTVRDANWSFSYSSAQPLSAGVYNGQLQFTASAP